MRFVAKLMETESVHTTAPAEAQHAVCAPGAPHGFNVALSVQIVVCSTRRFICYLEVHSIFTLRYIKCIAHILGELMFGKTTRVAASCGRSPTRACAYCAYVFFKIFLCGFIQFDVGHAACARMRRWPQNSLNMVSAAWSIVPSANAFATQSSCTLRSLLATVRVSSIVRYVNS